MKNGKGTWTAIWPSERSCRQYAEYLEDAKAMELTDGSRPMAFVTREEAAVMARGGSP